MYRPLYRVILFFLAVALGMGLMSLPNTFASTSRDVLIEDLTTGSVEADIYHRAERPGRVVRIVPWLEADGDFSLLAITEVGWVYQSGDDPSEWTLVGRILDSAEPR